MKRMNSAIIAPVTQILFWILFYTEAYPQNDILSNYLVEPSTDDIVGPIINPPTKDETLEINTNFTIECKAKEPIHWRIMQKELQPNFNYIVEHMHEIGNRHPFRSTLSLINVDYLFVGNYYCVHNSSADIENIDEIINDFHATEIYIYVNDKEHLLVPTYDIMLTAVQYSDVVFPCKPTSKNVAVKLMKDDVESLQFNFDPKIGFTIKILELEDSGHYSCSANYDGQTDEQFVEVAVKTDTTHVNKPILMSKTGKYGTEGEELHINCTVEIQVGSVFIMNWFMPNENQAEKEGRVIQSTTIKEPAPHLNGMQYGRSSIVVKNLNRNDSGYYKCEVSDHSHNRNSDNINIAIIGKNQGIIDIREPSGKYTIEISSTKPSAAWRVLYSGSPHPELHWFDNNNNEIFRSSNTTDSKYELTITHDYTVLKIKQLELKDTGIYVLRAHNGLTDAEKHFKLTVKDRPSVDVKDVYVMPKQTAKVVCKCAGYPKSDFTWSYTPCQISPLYPSCDESKRIQVDKKFISTSAVTELAQESELNFIPEHPGVVRCMAKNSEGNDTSEAKIIVVDLEPNPMNPENDKPDYFSVWGIDKQKKIAIGDTVTINCGAAVYDYYGDLEWFFEGEKVVEDGENVQIINLDTNYSYRKQITWKQIIKQQSGYYECRAKNSNEVEESRTIEVLVNEPETPTIEITNLNELTISKVMGQPLRLTCSFTGIPIPTIVWYKDGEVIKISENDTRIRISNNETNLDIEYIMIEDEGEYKCEGTNRLGSNFAASKLVISNKDKIPVGYYIAIGVVLIVLLICSLYFCIRFKRQKKLLRELKAAGLANFEDGSPDSINPDLTLDEQADLLPYNKKYEFPREKLKLGKQLGAGAFGIVVKGTAQGILPYEEETTVAVKMVKQTADNEVMRALVSELKIMCYLGQHLNVVNLLGAITKNIAKREVMVLVEYCRFGNVQNFLIKHREYFIDQINPETDTIDPTILTKEARWSTDSGYDYTRNSTTKPPFGSHLNSKGYIRHSGMPDYFSGGMDSSNTETGLISTSPAGGEDNLVLSNNSVQPAWRSNYKMDYKGPMRTVTTTDLVCWSFQVARGMEYLASRKVLHGDLAARNILLCDDNIVKICDFGLARSMYKSDNYKKKGEAPLPFKWLAIESIGDQVFSTYSDVWSFGIVLWELFSLGKVPYPGMDADQGLYFKLRDGYRMEKPMNATQDVYDIMLQCWSANPESRPLFPVLVGRLEKLLGNGVAEHYIDLNDPYLQMNTDNFKDGGTDYLSIIKSPDEIAPAIPHYVNSHIQTTAPDYLLMSPKTGSAIFSPRIDGPTTVNEEHFQFPDPSTLANNLSQSPNKTRLKPEEMPMLKSSSFNANSDSETETGSPNPSISVISGKAQFMDNADNYVNVASPPIKSLRITPKAAAVSNPGYVAFNKVNETRT